MIIICPPGESTWQNERLEARFKEQPQVADFLFEEKADARRGGEEGCGFSVGASEAMQGIGRIRALPQTSG